MEGNFVRQFQSPARSCGSILVSGETVQHAVDVVTLYRQFVRKVFVIYKKAVVYC